MTRQEVSSKLTYQALSQSRTARLRRQARSWGPVRVADWTSASREWRLSYQPRGDTESSLRVKFEYVTIGKLAIADKELTTLFFKRRCYIAAFAPVGLGQAEKTPI